MSERVSDLLMSDALNLGRNGSPGAGARPLVDVAHDNPTPFPRVLDRVGMAAVELMVRRRDEAGGLLRLPARAEATVRLDDPRAKGIHMSRLFLHAQEVLDHRDLTPAAVLEILDRFLVSHREISHGAQLTLSFEHLLQRRALLSPLSGWRAYPVRIDAVQLHGTTRQRLTVRVTYSSTCPCSAALARQLIQERFFEEFGDREDVAVDDVALWLGTQRALAALPHSQRSHADVTIELPSLDGSSTGGAVADGDYPLTPLIDILEQALKTPVQTVVKRVDEQEFARLNSEHLMFCEDAARQLAHVLDDVPFARDYHVRVAHLESLHPHDAVAEVTKGVPGGMTA